MKKIIFLLLFLQISIWGFSKKYLFDQVELIGVENPMSMAISPDGLQMIVIDCPKKENTSMKLLNRPYIESKWGVAIPVKTINSLIGKETHVEAPFFSYDGTKLFFAANFSDTKGGMDIYYSQIIDGKIIAPVNMPGVINTEADENCPSLSGSNRTFYFTREVEMKKLERYNTGEMYVASLQADSKTWSEPEKINTEINSGGIAYPKISDDNRTIFYTCITDDKDGWKVHWTKKYNTLHWFLPVKLDTLDSGNSEIAPVYCKQDGYLYYVVLDAGGFHPEGSVFKYKLPDRLCPDKTIHISGNILDKRNNEALEATILVTDPVLNTIKYFVNSDKSTGHFDVLLTAGADYMFHICKDNFSHIYKLMPQKETQSDVFTDFQLFPIVNVQLNVYDKEELWPLESSINVVNKKGKKIDINPVQSKKGQVVFQLEIGQDYSIIANSDYHYQNRLELALSNVVLFDELVRDIELIPEKRTIEIDVVDKETSNPLTANSDVFDKWGRAFKPEVVAGRIGEYKITLREGEAFDLEVRGPKGFAFKHEQFDLAADKSLTRLTVELQPLMVKVPIRLNNINFEYNSADLLEGSYSELNRVVQLLKENPDIHVEIMAHTDDFGSDEYNNVLANKRANSVVDYLVVVGGIANDRLVPKGYGESMPLVPNDSDENRAKNRRVEMKILDENDADYMIEERVITE